MWSQIFYLIGGDTTNIRSLYPVLGTVSSNDNRHGNAFYNTNRSRKASGESGLDLSSESLKHGCPMDWNRCTLKTLINYFFNFFILLVYFLIKNYAKYGNFKSENSIFYSFFKIHCANFESIYYFLFKLSQEHLFTYLPKECVAMTTNCQVVCKNVLHSKPPEKKQDH